MKNKKLAKEILRMAKLDQGIRKAYVKAPRLIKKVKEVDRRNLTKMKRIIEEHGWPTITLVGNKASRMAWLIVQHADSDVKFQEYCLGLMREAAKDEQVLKTNIAYLVDRILVNKGKPQIYGTQFYKNKKGELAPRPIKNMKILDKLRKKMGLESFKLYKNELRGDVK